MALFPCAVHGTRFRGQALHAYGFVSRRDSTTRSHLRLCDRDMTGLVELAQEQMLAVSNNEEDLYPDILECCGCHLPIEGSYDVWIVTAYPAKQDKQQFIAGLHYDCALPTWFGSLHERGLQAA